MEISLLENAYNFLDEALLNAINAENDTIRWKYAILNLVQAIELSLKERLKREHPILLYKDIDKPKLTVNLYTALQRLKNISKLELSKADQTEIDKAVKLRNEIVHFKFNIDDKTSKLNFAKLLGFLSHFHSSHLEKGLEQVVNPDYWQQAVSIFEYAEELFNKALEIFKKQNIDPELAWICPNCGWQAFITKDNINSCYVCGQREEIIKCFSCEKYLFEKECHELQDVDESYQYFCVEFYEKILCQYEEYYP